jgi:hypothetical protein
MFNILIFIKGKENEKLLFKWYCNVDGQSHARPDRDMPVAAQPLGCDVTQQEGQEEINVYLIQS